MNRKRYQDSPVKGAEQSECHWRAGTPWGPVPVPPPGHSWESLMQLALGEAEQAAYSEEIPVGAVLVAADGTLLASAHNQPVSLSDPSAHAEIRAIRAAGLRLGNYRLDRTILIATLEPCLMCAGAIVHARIAGVVYGASDAKAGAVSSCLNAFELPFLNHHPWHMGGILSAPCASLLRRFFERKERIPT